MKQISLTPAFTDDRGIIIDMLENANINNITLVTFTAGAIRGNHYHKLTTQWNYLLSGRLSVRTQFPGQGVVETVMGPGDMYMVFPEECHAFQCLEDAAMMVFTQGPRGGKEYETDTFRMETPLLTP